MNTTAEAIKEKAEILDLDGYGSSLLKATVDLLVKVAELHSAEEDLRQDTYGGNGNSRWPDPNDGQGQSQGSGKKYKDEVGLHIKRFDYFGVSKRIDYKKRNAVEDVNRAIKKIEDALDVISKSTAPAGIESENK